MNSSNLKVFQTEFLNHILRPHSGPIWQSINNNIGAFKNNKNNQNNKNNKQNSYNSLQIYKNNYIKTIYNTLQQTYNACYKITGKKYFFALIKQYIQHPIFHKIPNIYNLYYLGETFVNFIANHNKITQNLPYLTDLAKLEWIINIVNINNTNNNFNLQQLINLHENQLLHDATIFVPVKNSFLLQSKYPIDQIWNLTQQSKPKLENNINLNYNNNTINLFIWQQNYNLIIHKLTNTEYILIDCLTKKLPFINICNMLQSKLDQFNINHIAHILTQLINKGYIEII